MNLSDSLDVELSQRQSQSLGRNITGIGNYLDEHVLENLYERQVTKSTPMKHAMTLCQQDTAAAALSLYRYFREINMFCCCCSRMSLTIVLNLW